MRGVWAEPRKAKTIKHSKFVSIRNFARGIGTMFGTKVEFWHAVDKVYSCGKSKRPEFN